jgi:hypothetical protein
MLRADSRSALVEDASAPAIDGRFLDADDCRDMKKAARLGGFLLFGREHLRGPRYGMFTCRSHLVFFSSWQLLFDVPL